MRVPLSMLREFLGDLGPTADVVARLDALGLAVETVLELPSAPSGVVIAEVLDVTPLAGSDRLVVAHVTDGARRYDVVTGAPNVVPGLRTALALPGARLDAADLTVAERDVLGVRSQGMVCSARELGLYDHAAGVMAFGADAAPGRPLADAWPAETVLVLELTPNRADAFSVLGVARDLAASLDLTVRDPRRAGGAGPEADGAIAFVGSAEPGDASLGDGLEIDVQDPQRCPRLTLRRIDDVTVGPSPIWLQHRLAALGLRPRNNVVDATNYVTFELGQPSHAYDVAALAQGVVQVRRAHPGERLVTLGEQELELGGEDLVIATPDGAGSRAIGLAGVIGGLHDSVGAETRSVALEVAHFEPVGIRRTARRHRLGTDAHYRFERGVDPNLPPTASARAAALIAAVGGGRVHPGVSTFGGDAVRPAISFRPERVAFLTGLEVPTDVQRAFLMRLGCEVVVAAPTDAWRVAPPSWRFDLAIEEDLVEEVARLHGYEHIGSTVPAMSFVPPLADPTHRRLRDALVGAGLLETISYVFTSERELAAARAPAPQVRLAEPQGADRAVLRTSLVPGLLAAARSNHAVADLALFEVGRVFLESEVERVALLVRGSRLGATWRPGVAIDFFVAKGLLERAAEGLGARLTTRPGVAPHLHPGVAAEVLWNDRVVGTLGRVHPEVAAAYEVGEAYVAELTLPLEPSAPALVALPRQPYAERDLAVVVPASVGYEALRDLVAAAAGPSLASLAPFDVYEGAQVGAGRRSVALRLRFRHPERALTDDEVDRRMKDVMDSLVAGGYSVRG